MNNREKKVKKRLSNAGYALLAAIIAVNIFAVLVLKARSMWETAIQRDMEQELIFRGNQYVLALEAYHKKNANKNPPTLEELVEKKFLRKLYKDPMTDEGEWDLVVRDGRAGKKGLLVVPAGMLEQYISQGQLVGVCSSSPDEGYFIYRKKKKYFEWAFFEGQKLDKDMPELKYVGHPGYTEEDNNTGNDNNSNTDKDGRTIDE